MTITLVGSASAAGSSVTATTATVTVPAGSIGDLLLIGVAASSNATAGSNAPLITSSSGALTRLSGVEPGICTGMLLYRFVQGGDSTTYTFTLSSGAPEAIVCLRYSGVSSVRFWDAACTMGQGVTSASVTLPSNEGVRSSDLVVSFVAMGRNTKAASVTTPSTPSGWTQQVTKNGPLSSLAFAVTTAMYDKLGATDTPSVSGSTGAWVAHNVVLVDSASLVPDAPDGTITFVAATTATVTSAGQASLVINKPSGVVDGHAMILAVSSSNLNTFAIPSGWTPVGVGFGAYSLGTTSYSIDVASRVFYKIASGEGSSYTLTIDSTQVTAAAIAAYSGVRGPFPIGMIGEVNTNSGSAVTTSPAPYVLPNVRATHLIVNVYTAGSDVSPGTSSVTGPSGTWTQRAQVATSVASNPGTSITIAEKQGAVDQPTATASTVQTWTVYSIALVGTPQLYAPRRLGPNYRR